MVPNMVKGIKRRNDPERRLPKKNEIAPVMIAFLAPITGSLVKKPTAANSRKINRDVYKRQVLWL